VDLLCCKQTIFVLLSFCIALVVSDLGIVIALIGATGSTTINYILPGAVYWRLHESDGSSEFKRKCAGGLFILGCIIMPVCVTFIFI
jgi:amino acid permease